MPNPGKDGQQKKEGEVSGAPKSSFQQKRDFFNRQAQDGGVSRLPGGNGPVTGQHRRGGPGGGISKLPGGNGPVTGQHRQVRQAPKKPQEAPKVKEEESRGPLPPIPNPQVLQEELKGSFPPIPQDVKKELLESSVVETEEMPVVGEPGGEAEAEQQEIKKEEPAPRVLEKLVFEKTAKDQKVLDSTKGRGKSNSEEFTYFVNAYKKLEEYFKGFSVTPDAYEKGLMVHNQLLDAAQYYLVKVKSPRGFLGKRRKALVVATKATCEKNLAILKGCTVQEVMSGHWATVLTSEKYRPAEAVKQRPIPKGAVVPEGAKEREEFMARNNFFLDHEKEMQGRLSEGEGEKKGYKQRLVRPSDISDEQMEDLRKRDISQGKYKEFVEVDGVKTPNPEKYTRGHAYLRTLQAQSRAVVGDFVAGIVYPVPGGEGGIAAYQATIDRIRSGHALAMDVERLQLFRDTLEYVEELNQLLGDPEFLLQFDPKIIGEFGVMMQTTVYGTLVENLANIAGMFGVDLARNLGTRAGAVGEQKTQVKKADFAPAQFLQALDGMIRFASEQLGKKVEKEDVRKMAMQMLKPGAPPLTKEQTYKLLRFIYENESSYEGRQQALETEEDTKQLIESMGNVEVSVGTGSRTIPLRQAIKSYVTDSADIRRHIYGIFNLALNEDSIRDKVAKDKVAPLDTALKEMGNKQGKVPRLSFRSMTYENALNVPYRTGAIKPGDTIRDKGFTSTSTNKQFLMGRFQSGAVTEKHMVKMMIYGSSGVPIAAWEATENYSTGSYEALAKMPERGEAKPLPTSGTQAGQAEILYPRNTAFKIVAVSASMEHTLVICTEVEGDAGGNVKDMYTGERSEIGVLK